MLNSVRLFVVSFHTSTSYSFHFNPYPSIFISNLTPSSYKFARKYEEDISMERQKIPAVCWPYMRNLGEESESVKNKDKTQLGIVFSRRVLKKDLQVSELNMRWNILILNRPKEGRKQFIMQIVDIFKDIYFKSTYSRETSLPKIMCFPVPHNNKLR